MNQSEKIDEIYNMVHAHRNEMSTFIAYQKNHAEMLKEHAIMLKEHEAYKNRIVGKISILSMVFTIIGAGIVGLIKLFTAHN